MTILIADKLERSVVDALQTRGFNVVVAPTATGDELVQTIADVKPQILVVRSTKVPAAAMAAGNIELIVRAGAGYDNIDVAEASARGTFVSNCPGKNAVAVAELTMGLIVALDRKIADNVMDAREGRWNKAGYSKAEGLKGKTIGIIGLGSIGREVARRAQAFGMRVVAWSRSLTPDDAATLGFDFAETPVAVAEQSDIVTLHVAATPETANLADRTLFTAMKDGAFFINTTRSSVVDEDALMWAMRNKGIRVGLDVFSNEPSFKEGDFSHPLAAHAEVYLTHHIGASTTQAQVAIAEEAERVIRQYAEKGVVSNCVNIALRTPATHMITVRHIDKVGVLAAVLDECKAAEWNVQEMENRVFQGARAAVAKIRFHGVVEQSVVDRIAANEDVLAVTLVDL
ncbi:MAG: hydroxyacid dehydrogenase [Rhodothermales bacterium]|nr:hydroxyacid dehydrogenase [Rhodothermales bacterium]